MKTVKSPYGSFESVPDEHVEAWVAAGWSLEDETTDESTIGEGIDLTKLSRDELNAIALESGIGEPDKLKTKQAVIEAIVTAADESTTGEA